MRKKTSIARVLAAAILLLAAACSGDDKSDGDFFSSEPSRGPLEVLVQSPSGEEMPVTTEGVTVIFDRPMIPLTVLDEGKAHAIPVTVDPPAEGSFHWLGSKGFIYRFKKPLTASTVYRVTIPEGVRSLDGHATEKKLEWTFSTMRPAVRSWRPAGGAALLPREAALTLTFNVAMNRAEVEQGLDFVPEGGDKSLSIKKTLSWSDDDHVLKVAFDGELPWGTSFRAVLPAGTRGRAGSLGLKEAASAAFRTPAADARVTAVFYYGEDGKRVPLDASRENAVNAGTGLCVEFSQPIDSGTFEEAFRAEAEAGALERHKPFFYYQGYDTFYTGDDEASDGGYREGYRTGCVAMLEEFNRGYRFSVDGPKVRTLSGAAVTNVPATYAIRTPHAVPEVESNLTESILSQKGPLKIPYKSLNAASVKASLFRLDGPEQFSEEVKNLRHMPLKQTYDETTKLSSPVYPPVGEALRDTTLELPLSESEPRVIDVTRRMPLASREIVVGAKEDAWGRFHVDLADFFPDGGVPSGFYLVEVAGAASLPGARNPDPVYSMVQVAGVALAVKRESDHVLAWATDIESGAPVAGLPLNAVLLNEDGTFEAKSAVTGDDGTALMPGKWSTEEYDYSLTLCVDSADFSRFAHTCQADHDLTGYRYVMEPGTTHFAYVYTDRPIYRPGQTVHFSAFVREVREGRYFLTDPGRKYAVKVTDAAAETVYEREETAENGGVVRGDFTLGDSEDTPRGEYQLTVTAGKQSFSRNFFVQSYRKPSFKVDLSAKTPEIVSGEPLEAEVSGQYFFGAPLKGAKTSWSIMTTTYRFAPEGYEGFSFLDEDLLRKRESEDGEYDGYDYDSDAEYDYVAGYPQSEEDSRWDDPRGAGTFRYPGDYFRGADGRDAESGAQRLDDKGALAIRYVPDLQDYPYSQVLTVEANVTDAALQEVSAADEVIVHKADWYLGVRPGKWAYGAQEKAAFEVVAVDAKGKPAAGKSFSAEFFRRDYNYIKRRNARGYWEFLYAPEDVKAGEVSAKADMLGRAVVPFDIPQGGTYRLVVKGKDERGNAIQAAGEIYAWGEGYVPWRLNEAQTLELVPDKDSYAVGETAKILVKSLLPVTKALVTYERGRVLEYAVKDLGGNATHIEIPVTGGMIPNFYLSVVAHVGRADDHPPLLYHGETEIAVSPESKRLNVAIETDRRGSSSGLPVYAPGDEVAVRLRTTDPQGAPRKAHVAVSVADEAVLRLLDYRLPDLVKKFYFRRTNQVRTSSSLVSLKAGDGSGDKKKRKLFQDTAHFEGHLETDESGTAEFRFKLPDDLTTWVIEAVAVSESKSAETFAAESETAAATETSDAGRLRAPLPLTDGTFVGGARASVMATLPVVMRAALPRFTAWGDRVDARVLLNNRNAGAVEGRLSVTLGEGAAFEDGSAKRELPFSVPAGREIALPVSFVIAPGTDEFVFAAEALAPEGAVFDALELRVPARDRFAPETVALSGTVTGEPARESLDLGGAEVETGRGGLSVSFKASLGLAAADPMRRLISFPWGCAEQKSGTLIALLMARDMGNKFGEKYFDALAPLTEKEMKSAPDFAGRVRLIEDKIYSLLDEFRRKFQSFDGGIRYWPDHEMSDVFASLQVAWASVFAREQGFAVDGTFLDSLRDYLRSRLAQPPVLSLEDEAYALWVLAKLETPAPGSAAKLVAAADSLSPQALSFALLALADAGESAAADPAWAGLAELRGRFIDRLAALAKQEPRHTSWPESGGFAATALKNTALAAHAVFRSDAAHPLVPRALAFLLNRKRSGQAYFSTQDDLYLSYFAYEYARRTSEAAASFTAKLSLAGNPAAERAFGAGNLLEEFRATAPMDKILSMKPPVEAAFSKDGAGTLYYDASLKYYLPAGKAPPREEGLVVAREYFSLDDRKEDTPLKEFKAGEVYKGRLVIAVPQAMNHVIVQDLLPAGFEPVDLRLATTSRALRNELGGGQESERESRDGESYDDEVAAEDYGADYAFSHQEVRDDSVMWSETFVKPGVYHLRYPVRAATAGTYLAPGAEAFEFYEPEIFGRSPARVVTVRGE